MAPFLDSGLRRNDDSRSIFATMMGLNLGELPIGDPRPLRWFAPTIKRLYNQTWVQYDSTLLGGMALEEDMSSRNVLIISVVVPIVGLLTLLGIGLARSQEPRTGLSGKERVNQPAVDFALPLFDGGELTLSSLKGKPVVINFWASWCVPCRAEAAVLEKTWRAYKDKGVTFIGMDIQDKESEARAFLKEFNITYPNGMDKKGKITIDYGVSGIPVTFFVDRDGRIVNRWVGAIGERLLVANIEELLR